MILRGFLIQKGTFILLISILAPLLLISQETNFNLIFRNVTIDDGLTDNQFNNYFFEDSKGFTWISSIDGLNRFNGLSVQSYRSESGLEGKNIQSDFFEDQKSNIWFSTYKYINCYVRSKDTILSFQLKEPNDQLLIHEDYNVFYYDSLKNRVWAKAGEYIYGIDAESPEKYFFLPKKTKGSNFNISVDSNGQLKEIIASPWYGLGIDLFTLNDSNLLNYNTFLPEVNSISKSINIESSRLILIIDGALYYFDKQNKTKKALNISAEISVWDVLKVDKDLIFFSTDKSGLFLYNLRSEKVIHHWKKDSKTIISNSPREVDLNEKLLWVSHRNKGVSYSFLSNNEFAFSSNIDETSEIISLVQDEVENIWIGTKFQGILIFEENGNLLKKIPQIDSSQLWQVFKDKKNQIFAATSEKIYQFNKEFEIINSFEKEKGLTFLNEIYPKRTLINTPRGVKEFSQNSKGNFLIEKCTEFSSDSTFSFVHKLYQTSRKKLYVPYNANELWIYDATNDGLKEITKLKCNLEFFGFCESKKYAGTIWAGSSRGLAKIVRDTVIEFVFEDPGALGGGNVYGIVEDNDGVLWISTNQGLWQYFPETGETFQYEEVDGLVSNTFSLYNSTLYSSSGDIWMGTNKGLVKFNPKEIKPFTVPPKVYINEVLVNDKRVIKGAHHREALTFPYDSSTLEFDVSSVGYYKADRSKLIYRIAGYDEEWLEATNGLPIRYTKIPPGKYNFEVRAEDVNRNTSKLKILPIEITPPYWQTWWFWALVLGAFLLLVYGIYRYRIAEVRRDQEKITAIETLKVQVLDTEMKALRAQMNPHFLFNSMNSIKGIIIKKEERKAAFYLTKFSSLLRAILTNSEKKKILLSKELEALKLYIELETLRFDDGFDYQIQVDKTIDPKFVRIPPLVLQPFVENAILHGLLPKTSEDKKLIINIFRKEDDVILEVEDNGVGRRPEAETKAEKTHKSMGISITRKRIQMLHEDNDVQIIDLVSDTGEPLGTKVVIRLFSPE